MMRQMVTDGHKSKLLCAGAQIILLSRIAPARQPEYIFICTRRCTYFIATIWLNLFLYKGCYAWFEKNRAFLILFRSNNLSNK